MSLQIWLPMTKDFSNQGLQNSTITNNSATLDNNGKLGKCGYFSGSTYLKGTIDCADWVDYSLACWIKPPTASANNKQVIAIGKSSGWTNCRATIVYVQNSTDVIAGLSDGTNSIQYSMRITLTANAWNHIVVTYSNKTLKFYLNGVYQKSYTTTFDPKFSDITNFSVAGASDGAEKFTGYLNDVRIYNNALSDREIEVLSRGLVCHYPLCDNSIQVSNVSNTSTTFNTSNADGGWSHWGQSGHKGSCGQTTSSTYIYTSGQSYAHRVTNASGATGNYLMYQSPSFSATGGYRSMSAIIKEVNGNKITDAICYPVWNGAADDKPYVWDTISPLGNGFYLCKVESFQQDGTNNLVGIYVKPGKEIYVTNCYIENDRQACSDFIFGTSTAVYDCSGFQNNMTASGTVSCNVDSARYSKSTHFINGSYLMATQNSPTYLPTDGLTVNIWVKPTTWGTPISCTEGGGWNIELSTNGLQFQCYISSVGYKGAASTVKASDLIDGKWHMLTGTFDRIAQQTKFYIDGELKGTNSTGSSNGVGYANNRLIISGEAQTTTPASSDFIGEESDVRIYATALSADDIKELYNTAVSVANNGTLMGYELVEG